MENTQATAPVYKWRIYGKHEGQKRFKPMDLKRGQQVTNLIYATMLTDEQKEKFLSGDANLNPDWQFEAREIPGGF